MTTKVANVPAPTPITRSPDREARHAGSKRHDASGELAAQRARVSRIHAERVQHVAEVEADRLDLDLDLSRPRRRPRRGTHARLSRTPRGATSRRSDAGAGTLAPAAQGDRRDTRRTPPRHATNCSASAASTSAASSSAFSVAGSRSTSVARSSGRSSAITRPSPQSGDWARARSAAAIAAPVARLASRPTGAERARRLRAPARARGRHPCLDRRLERRGTDRSVRGRVDGAQIDHAGPRLGRRRWHGVAGPEQGDVVAA